MSFSSIDFLSCMAIQCKCCLRFIIDLNSLLKDTEQTNNVLSLDLSVRSFICLDGRVAYYSVLNYNRSDF